MSEFDDDIRQALRPEDTASDEGLLDQVAATFRTRMRLWIVLIWCLTALCAAAAVWAASRFFRAATTRDWIMYATMVEVAATAVVMLKLWYWMEMNRHTHTREIKRLEILVAKLADRMGGM
jgi:uncharacterized membrane protein YcjF (UPF0283 family)